MKDRYIAQAVRSVLEQETAFLEGYFSIDQPESCESVIPDAMDRSLQQRLRVLGYGE